MVRLSPAPAGLFRAPGRTENCRLVGLQPFQTAASLPCAMKPMMPLGVGVVGLSSGEIGKPCYGQHDLT